MTAEESKKCAGLKKAGFATSASYFKSIKWHETSVTPNGKDILKGIKLSSWSNAVRSLVVLLPFPTFLPGDFLGA